MRYSHYYIIIICLFTLLFSCKGEEVKQTVDNDSLNVRLGEPDSLLELTQEQADSLEFRFLHHYTNNFNFIVKADSLVLVPQNDEMSDTCVVHHDEIIVVADIKAADTVWIKVARDQYSMGWIPEEELLKGAIPDDPISMVIDFLTGSRAMWMSAIVVLGLAGFFFRRRIKHKLQIFRFDEMDSFYPVLLLIIVSLMACLYASIQNFTPEFWQEYYFHPTLNPLVLPPIMAILVSLVWLVIIVFIALITEVYNHFYFVQGISYLLEMLGAAMISYLLISWTTMIYVGYFLVVAYIAILLWVYFKYIRCRYICGNCGRKMQHKGICPHCGKRND